MARILVVDDSDDVRRSVLAVLADAIADLTVGEATAAGPALALLDRERWDLVLLDLSLPDRSGMDALRDIRRSHLTLPVLVMSLHPESEYGEAVRAAGATGYVAKGSTPQAIVAAVKRALDGVPGRASGA